MKLNFKINQKTSESIIRGEDVTLVLSLTDSFTNSPYDSTTATSIVAKFQNADGTFLSVTPTSLRAGVLSIALSAAQTQGLTLQDDASIELVFVYSTGTLIAVLEDALDVGNQISAVTSDAFRGYLSISRVTSSFTLSKTVDVYQVDASAGAISITIPTADGSTGRWVIQKVDSTLNRISTIGAYADHIDTLNETIELITNGSSWGVLRRSSRFPWLAYTPAVLNGVSVMTFSTCSWRREGDSIRCRGYVVSGAADGNSSRFELNVLPSGLTIGSLGVYSDLLGTAGEGKYFRNAVGTYAAVWLLRSNGNICPQPTWTVNGYVASNLQNADAFSWNVLIPVSQWNG